MAISITGKLNKAANQFQAGESTGFGVRLGVRYYDRETQQNEYTNYEAVIFAKAPAQVQFYQQALVEGSVIELSGTTQKIKSFDGQNGQVLSIEIHDAKLGFVHTGNQPQQQAQQSPQQQYQQQQRQQAPQQQYNAPQQQQYQQSPPVGDDFSDSIPF
ncbi:nucleic acid-binding, OB-fold protein [Vibrio phage 1.090.B._10N.286.48.F1]|nr:nucleic acid-binding, OB-fold protein [Vibrio phage 1.090.B._10N.286.48.F1]